MHSMSSRLSPRTRRWCFAALAAVALSAGSAEAENERCETVDREWIWFSDHAAFWISYVVEAAPGRRYKVGTGLSIGGKPRGGVREASGRVEVIAYGVGALHVRFVDDGEPATICAAQGDLKTVTFPAVEF